MNTLHLILLWRIGCLLAAWLLGAGTAAWAQQSDESQRPPPTRPPRVRILPFQLPRPVLPTPPAGPQGALWFPTIPPQRLDLPRPRVAYQFGPNPFVFLPPPPPSHLPAPKSVEVIKGTQRDIVTPGQPAGGRARTEAKRKWRGPLPKQTPAEK